jgi:hypothetical protein
MSSVCSEEGSLPGEKGKRGHPQSMAKKRQTRVEDADDEEAKSDGMFVLYITQQV